jgi:4-aminobutyrate aminotransferase / (S)-3-amino-2-methylpropionate transaminase
MASVASAPPHEGEKPFFPDEPNGPSVKTEIPGPKSKAAVEKLDKIFETRSLNMMGDYSKSYGN